MLKPSYAAIQQFQRQISNINTIKDLKTILRRLDLSITLQIESPTVWKLSWNLLENIFSETLEIRIQTCLISGSESFKARHFTTLRLEEPVGIALSTLEGKLMGLIKQSIGDVRGSI